jgi:hypothetical protein
VISKPIKGGEKLLLIGFFIFDLVITDFAIRNDGGCIVSEEVKIN